MKVIVAPHKEEASDYVASSIAALMSTDRSVRIGLATGETMVSVYQELVQQLTIRGQCGMGYVETFNLDEYWPIEPGHFGSFAQFMHRHLFSHVSPWIQRSHILRGDAPHPNVECGRFQSLLAERPLDAQLLGLGVNGHIGFNEPGTSFQSRTRKVMLSSSTKKRNAPQFPGEMPDYALTMGIADIMEAKAIILVVFGSQKQEVLTRAILGSVSEDCPASILQTHPNVTIVADKVAASGLSHEHENLSLTVTTL